MANPLKPRFPLRAAPGRAMAWPNEHADRGYVIFFTGRCGSTHLVDLLSQTGLCGSPDEFFNESFLDGEAALWHGPDVAAYAAELVARRSSGRRFGFKIDGLRHRWLCEIADPLALFPPSAFGFVYMNRRNVLEQAYSYAHAKRSGAWHRTRDGAPPATGPAPGAITDRELWEELAIIYRHESLLEGYFRDQALPVMRIDYEMMCASEAFVVADVMLAARRSLDEIGAALESLRPRHMKIDYDGSKTRRLIDFQAKYREQLGVLAGQRGRPLGDAQRQFFAALTGIDLASV
jgi:LPS sulfotransferase NodH